MAGELILLSFCVPIVRQCAGEVFGQYEVQFFNQLWAFECEVSIPIFEPLTVADVCELIVDCVNKTAPVIDELTPYKMLRTTNIKGGRIDREDCRRVDKATFTKWTRRADVRRGDVILTREAPLGTHQLQHYNAVLAKGKKGTPVMFFALPQGNKKKVPKSICDEVEEVLIQSALYENPDLRNVQKAKAPAWGIDGVVRGKKGKPTKNESGFKKMMGL